MSDFNLSVDNGTAAVLEVWEDASAVVELDNEEPVAVLDVLSESDVQLEVFNTPAVFVGEASDVDLPDFTLIFDNRLI